MIEFRVLILSACLFRIQIYIFLIFNNYAFIPTQTASNWFTLVFERFVFQLQNYTVVVARDVRSFAVKGLFSLLESLDFLHLKLAKCI